jgi:hypothetical protein
MNSCKTICFRNIVCFRYIILNTLHKGDNKDNNNNNNNNSNIAHSKFCGVTATFNVGSEVSIHCIDGIMY